MYLAKLISDLTVFFSPEKFCRDFPAVDGSYLISASCRRDYICGFLQNLLCLFLNPYKKIPSALEKELKGEIASFLDRIHYICSSYTRPSGQRTINFFDN